MTIAQHFNLSPRSYFPVIASILIIALSIFAKIVPAMGGPDLILTPSPLTVCLNTSFELSVIIKKDQSLVDRVEVSVITPTSEISPQGYINTLSVDLKPQENDRWEGQFELTAPGKYTFIFKVYYRTAQGDQSKEADDPITIYVPDGESDCTLTSEIPNLPNLSSGFRGGIAIDGQHYQTPLQVSLSQPVVIVGEMTIGDRHLTQPADIVAFATYLPEPNNPNNKLFYMLDSNGVPVSWDGDMAHLMVFKQVNLPKHQKVVIYSGVLVPGNLKIYFGYRLPDGTVIANEIPIEVDVLM